MATAVLQPSFMNRVSKFGEAAASMVWADLHEGNGTVTSTGDGSLAVWLTVETKGIYAPLDQAHYDLLSRVVIIIDKSTLPAGAIIQSAVLRLYTLDIGYYGSSPWPTSWGLAVVTASPASNSAIAATDFSAFGDTLLTNSVPSSELLLENEYYDFTFNVAGLAYLNSEVGVIRLGLRESVYDIADEEPVYQFNSGCNAQFKTSITLPVVTVVYETVFDIDGTVIDGGGNPVPGVEVYLTGEVETSDITDENGGYSFPDLAPGPYSICINQMLPIIIRDVNDALNSLDIKRSATFLGKGE